MQNYALIMFAKSVCLYIPLNWFTWYPRCISMDLRITHSMCTHLTSILNRSNINRKCEKKCWKYLRFLLLIIWNCFNRSRGRDRVIHILVLINLRKSKKFSFMSSDYDLRFDFIHSFSWWASFCSQKAFIRS